ncbi:hypothetical protein E2C01_008410 [Portunus trituberculatus]|uniref:Uncharacterized protein n=1 Tax=Portunus trituberculatus TaxID=210409 RepID=A0A5B7D320_PORTR|nr:hypothetical protein [Portunus trituberculatus]
MMVLLPSCTMMTPPSNCNTFLLHGPALSITSIFLLFISL